MNVADILSEHARTRPHHPAIEDGARTVTYGELDKLVDAAAANLQAAGIGRGDLVAVLLDDSIDHLTILCALARVGATIFSLNATASELELEASVAGVSAKAIVLETPRQLGRGLLPLDTRKLLQEPRAPFRKTSAGGDDPLMLIQSSGTTGAPKSFLRSHAEVETWIARYVRGYRWTPAERSA